LGDSRRLAAALLFKTARLQDPHKTAGPKWARAATLLPNGTVVTPTTPTTAGVTCLLRGRASPLKDFVCFP